MAPWRMDFQDAYQAWIVRHGPSVDEELEMLLWLGEAESYGPRPGANKAGNYNTKLASGTRVMYRSFPHGDGGYVLVMKVT